MPFKKGKSGNPSTQFTSDQQPQNRRKPSIITTVKKMMVDEAPLLFKGVHEINENGIKTGRKVNVSIEVENEDGFALLLLKRAKKNDNILKFLVEQIDGKAKAEIVHRVELEGFDVDLLNAEQSNTFIHLLQIGMREKENNQKLI